MGDAQDRRMDETRMVSEASAAPGAPAKSRPAARHRAVALACVVFVAAMVGMAYAAVPLYAAFCQLTGFGGATRKADSAPGKVLDRQITVRFDANVAPGLPWAFGPEQRSVSVKVGETAMAYYFAQNKSAKQTFANATYNVTPEQAGAYFVKMQCFCFSEQTLQAGEKLDMPVVFFIDPAIADDPELNSVKTITLSYTFFAAPEAARPVARADKAPAPKGGASEGEGKQM